ncbi:glycosyltransferase [Mycoplasma sp. P36-A1]|uniref:glycosyltransferase n=1 Tax=Mycoplasma sp. P36-A1 TaxID=3252900 RepID=UPI003C2FBCCE
MNKVMVVHGYVLSGTGSNLYVRNVVKKMCEVGQDVVLVCQEFTPEDYDFINRCFRQDGASFNLEFDRDSKYPGKCDIYIPDTKNELLVYVYDKYKHLDVKEMHTVSDQDIDNYINMNASCIKYIMENEKIDKAYSNHLVLQPQYVSKGIKDAKSDTKHIIIGHGSDLNYAISNSKYLEKLSIETLKSCNQLVAVSQHSKETMQEFYKDLDLSDCKVIPAGLDEQLYFDMDEKSEKEMLSEYIKTHDQNHGFNDKVALKIKEMVKNNDFNFNDVDDMYEAKDIEHNIKDKLFDTLYNKDLKKVIYLGKYLEQKGIIPLILGLPLLYANNPNTNVILVGFGALRSKIEYIINLIEQDKLEVLFNNYEKLNVTLQEDINILNQLKENLKDANYKEKYYSKISKLREATLFTGYFDQKYAIRILCHGKISIFPSIYTEAFGMVIIEAMAAKVTPLVTKHSGFKETLETAANEITDLDINELSVELDKDMLDNIVAKATTLLNADNTHINDEMSEFALKNYGWKEIAKDLLNL